MTVLAIRNRRDACIPEHERAPFVYTRLATHLRTLVEMVQTRHFHWPEGYHVVLGVPADPDWTAQFMRKPVEARFRSFFCVRDDRRVYFENYEDTPPVPTPRTPVSIRAASTLLFVLTGSPGSTE